MTDQRKYRRTVATWIVERARECAETAARAPLAGELESLDRLASLSTLELQSLSVRLGRYAWNRRLCDDDLREISRALLRAQAAAGEELDPKYRAFLLVQSALLEALRDGEEEAVSHCEPWQIERAAREVWREPWEERQVVNTLLVRSILEPLLAGDRSAYRTLLATLGRELVTLALKAMGRSLPGVTVLYAYAQLESLQDALNGVLQASRA